MEWLWRYMVRRDHLVLVLFCVCGWVVRGRSEMCRGVDTYAAVMLAMMLAARWRDFMVR